MKAQTRTIGELVKDFNNQPWVTISNADNPALKAHDALHIIFNLLGPSAKNEEIIAILQAVLKNDATVLRGRKIHESGNDHVNLKAVYEDVITPIHESYLPYLCEKAGITFKPYEDNTALGWNKILEWFEVAERFKFLFEAEYKKPYGHMPIDELMNLPAEPLREMANQTVERIDRIFSYLNSRHGQNSGNSR